MVTPKSDVIYGRARRIELSDITGGLPAITPTKAELRESGTYHRAKLQLMRSPATEARLHQLKYLDQMASELKLKVIPQRGLGVLKRETGWEWTNGWTRHEKGRKRPKVERKKVKPVPDVPIKRIVIGEKPKKIPSRRKTSMVNQHKIVTRVKKKRQRNHSERGGKTPRVLRKAIKNGHRVFSFGDDIWKVRKPRERKR